MNNDFICKRLRCYFYLVEKGFAPKRVVPDLDDYKKKNWVFDRTTELQQALDEWFNREKDFLK